MVSNLVTITTNYFLSLKLIYISCFSCSVWTPSAKPLRNFFPEKVYESEDTMRRVHFLCVVLLLGLYISFFKF